MRASLCVGDLACEPPSCSCWPPAEKAETPSATKAAASTSSEAEASESPEASAIHRCDRGPRPGGMGLSSDPRPCPSGGGARKVFGDDAAKGGGFLGGFR